MLRIGTSGWQYRDWRGAFYPPGLPQREWLAYYAQRFATVELNSSFYNLPDASSFERWREQTPDVFVVAGKMSRYLTQLRRLRDPDAPVDLVRAGLEERGAALCLADSPRRRTPAWRPADWGFPRFHEGRASPRPC